MECSQIDYNQILAVSNGSSNLVEIIKLMCLQMLFGQNSSATNQNSIIFMKFASNQYNDMKNIKLWLLKGVLSINIIFIQITFF